MRVSPDSPPFRVRVWLRETRFIYSLDCLLCLRDLQLIVTKAMSCSTGTKLEGVNSSAELAKRYSELSDLQRKHGEELIKKLSLGKNVKILDLGCGTGYLSSLLADSVGPGATVVAIDPNKSRLELAQKQYSRPNLLFVEANDVSLPEDQYDLVFSNYVLHWIENKAAVLKKVHQNLKPGGQFAFTVPEHQPTIIEKMDRMVGPKMMQGFHWMSAPEYNHLATTIGFKVTSSETEVKPLKFATVEGLLKWYHATTEGRFNPDKLDPTVLKVFKQSFGDGPIDIDLHRVTIIATKP